jgi:group II intron reverse transcriptase/maturase
VAIPKPDGGERELGVPTVTDRLIQQALLQVLQPLLDPTFSPHSYGFRPGRSAQQAVQAAQAHVQSGRRVVVDVDLEKFFDRVHHDILIDRLRKRVADAGVIRLVRAYLRSGIMDGGVFQEREQGTPQGGPLSPLLANVLLDEVDKKLEQLGHKFVRYADDANVYVRSRRAGKRVMALLVKLYGRLRLTVNQAKSAVASVFQRKFLGYSFWVAPWRQGQAPGGYEGDGEVQATGEATDPALRRTQPRTGGGTATQLCNGVEGIFSTGGYAEGLEGTGPMDTPPDASHPTQTMAARQDCISRTSGTRGKSRRCVHGGGKLPLSVAE